MDLNWTVLSVTAWCVVIIAIVGIMVANTRDVFERPRGIGGRRITTWKVVPHIASEWERAAPYVVRWLKSTWRPVVPLSVAELHARLGRGAKAALLLGSAALLLGASSVGEGWWLAIILYMAIPVFGLATGFGVAHAFLLRILPVRGPVMSALLGGLMGSALGRWIGESLIVDAPVYTFLGVIHGVVMGLVEFSVAYEHRERAAAAQQRPEVGAEEESGLRAGQSA